MLRFCPTNISFEIICYYSRFQMKFRRAAAEPQYMNIQLLNVLAPDLSIDILSEMNSIQNYASIKNSLMSAGLS